MTKRLPAVLAAVAAVFLLGNQADAQFFGRGGGGLGTRMASLAVDATVQAEISALDEQKEQLKSINDKITAEARAAFGSRGRGGRGGGGGRNLSEAERNKLMADARKKSMATSRKARKQLEEALLPHQYDRLQEIAIQALRSGAMTDEYVSARLKITGDQKKKFADIQTKQVAKMREMFSGGGGGGFDRSAIQKTMQKMQAETEKEMTGVLTKEQVASLTKMKGKAFKIPERRFGGPDVADAVDVVVELLGGGPPKTATTSKRRFY